MDGNKDEEDKIYLSIIDIYIYIYINLMSNGKFVNKWNGNFVIILKFIIIKFWLFNNYIKFS